MQLLAEELLDKDELDELELEDDDADDELDELPVLTEPVPDVSPPPHAATVAAVPALARKARARRRASISRLMALRSLYRP